jgi:fatty-acyl-CoA synthase
MFHCNGWGLPYSFAGVGARQVVLRKVDGAEILRRVERHGVTVMAGAPAVWNAVLDAAATWEGEIPGRDRVRIIVAGAPPPSKTIARVEQELGWEFNQIYGLTETAPLLTVNRPRAEYDDLDPEERAKQLSRAGVPTLGTRLAVSDTGEVLAQSNTVLAGYWDNPDASAEALDGGWFHTGDGGSMDDGGYLTISDRKKDVIITGGENVSSIEVEDAVFSHPAVAEVAVIGIPDDRWGEMVTALVVVAEGEQVSEADIVAHCRGRIAGYKIPKKVEFREAIPRTATGKIQKFKLREAYWQGSDRQVN